MTIENARRALQSDLQVRASKKKKALALAAKKKAPVQVKKPKPQADVLTELKEIRSLIEAQKSAADTLDFTITSRDRAGEVKTFKVKSA